MKYKIIKILTLILLIMILAGSVIFPYIIFKYKDEAIKKYDFKEEFDVLKSSSKQKLSIIDKLELSYNVVQNTENLLLLPTPSKPMGEIYEISINELKKFDNMNIFNFLENYEDLVISFDAREYFAFSDESMNVYTQIWLVNITADSMTCNIYIDVDTEKILYIEVLEGNGNFDEKDIFAIALRYGGYHNLFVDMDFDENISQSSISDDNGNVTTQPLGIRVNFYDEKDQIDLFFSATKECFYIARYNYDTTFTQN